MQAQRLIETRVAHSRAQLHPPVQPTQRDFPTLELLVHILPPVLYEPTVKIDDSRSSPTATHPASHSLSASSAPIVCYFSVPVAMVMGKSYADEFEVRRDSAAKPYLSSLLLPL